MVGMAQDKQVSRVTIDMHQAVSDDPEGQDARPGGLLGDGNAAATILPMHGAENG